jgi:hypothetical protein
MAKEKVESKAKREVEGDVPPIEVADETALRQYKQYIENVVKDDKHRMLCLL